MATLPEVISQGCGHANAVTQIPILMLNVHSHCNCRCLMCDIWQRDTRESVRAADLERHKISLQQLGVRHVVLTGGEPLLNTDLAGICEFFRGAAHSPHVAYDRSAAEETRRRSCSELRRRDRFHRRPSRYTRQHPPRAGRHSNSSVKALQRSAPIAPTCASPRAARSRRRTIFTSRDSAGRQGSWLECHFIPRRRHVFRCVQSASPLAGCAPKRSGVDICRSRRV